MEIGPEGYAGINQLQKRDSLDVIQEILRKGNKDKLKLIVDVGCGNGDVTQMLARAFPSAKIIAFDILPSMIKYSEHKLLPTEKERVDFVVQDFCAQFEDWNEKLRAVEGKVDLIWSTYALHWASLTARPNVIKNLVKLLKPEGLLYVDIMIARNFVPYLPKELEMTGEHFNIPSMNGQIERWVKYFTTIKPSLRSFNIYVKEKQWCSGDDNDICNHFKGMRTFVNFFRPFISRHLPDQQIDNILDSCAEHVFIPSLMEMNDGQLSYVYDCAQIRGTK